MKFKIKCRICGHEIWVRGHIESDVNATVIDDKDPWEDACSHMNDGQDVDIIDQKYNDDYD